MIVRCLALSWSDQCDFFFFQTKKKRNKHLIYSLINKLGFIIVELKVPIKILFLKPFFFAWETLNSHNFQKIQIFFFFVFLLSEFSKQWSSGTSCSLQITQKVFWKRVLKKQNLLTLLSRTQMHCVTNTSCMQFLFFWPLRFSTFLHLRGKSQVLCHS